jgi:Flp pilus assembly protein TadD
MPEEAAVRGASTGARLRAIFARSGYLEVLVFVVAVLAFIASAGFPFLFDDRMQIVANHDIQSWRGTLGYFAYDVWHSYDPTLLTKYYRPLFYLWVRINYVLFGLSPAGWHMACVLLHGAVSVLVFRLCARLTGSRVAGVVAGLLFAVHPVHIESVAWISGVTDPLMAVFVLPAMIFFLQWLEDHSPLRLAEATALYGLALLCKEPAIMLLPVLVKLAWLYRPEEKKALPAIIAGVLPAAALTVAYLGLRSWLFTGGAPTVNPLPVSMALTSLPELVLFYLRQSLFPVGLAFAYDFAPATEASWQLFWMPLLVLIAVAALFALWCARSQRQHRRALMAGAAIFAAWLLPVLNLRWLDANQAVHDRYLYLPVLGICLMVGVAFEQWRAKAPSREWLRVSAFAAICLLLIAATLTQQMNCASELLLWSRAARIAPHNDLALSNLGVTLMERGKTAEGFGVFQRELQFNPNSWNANYNMGYALFTMHDCAQAEPYIRRALAMRPASPETLRLMGGIAMKQGRLEEAEALMRRALEIDPRDEGFRTALGVVLLERGKHDEAVREFESELQMFPNYREAQRALESARGQSGRQ